MAEFEIDCINKPDRMSPHERIQYIGNQQGQWKLTLQSAVSRITRGADSFYVVDRITSRRVAVGVHPGHGSAPPFLQTHADGVWRDNLLALPECGPACRVID